jgi:BirA family biotin operon repressor/biotin-[acetyl-CoA-carboxylase] ligase
VRRVPHDLGPVLRVSATGSTNADLAAWARSGRVAAGTVLVAGAQTAGRGRLGRTWTSPPGTGLLVSVLVRPDVAVHRWTWLPLLTGLALAEAVDIAAAPVRPDLKWPNDLLVGPRKLAGVLVESVDDAAVLGCGLNVATDPADLPDGATSLAAEGAVVSREDLLDALLAVLARRLDEWTAADGDPSAGGLRAAYLARCATLGRPVRVALPDGATRQGTASGVDAEGRLVVAGTAYGAGDVVHLR